MARGQPQGEEVYRPEESALDLPRKMVPEIRGIAPVGQAISQFGDAIQTKYAADSAAAAGDQLATFRTAAAQSLQSMKEAQPADQDPTNFTERYLAQFDKQAQPLIDSAANNPYASAMLHKGLGDMRDSLAQHVMGWEAEQRVAYRTNSVKNNLDSQAAVVEAHPELLSSVGSTFSDQVNTIGGDPRNRLAIMQQVHQTLTTAAANGLIKQAPRGVLETLNDPEKAGPDFQAIKDLTDSQREAARARANEQLTRPIFAALEKDDTKGAQLSLEQNRDVMDEKTAWEMSRRIDAQVKQKQNDAKQAIADKLQDNMAAASMGIPSKDPMTRGDFQLLYPKDGDRRYQGYQTVIAASAQSQQYNKMTPEQIEADVKGSKPTEGGPGLAFEAQGYEIRAKAAEQSLRARQSDPAQFAITNGSWNALNFQDPKSILDELTTRANTQGQISEQTGVNTPLLSKPEQRTLTQFLESQPPSQRLGTLTQLRQSMPNDTAYGSLMSQIAPGSPLTAIAGATLDKPTGHPAWYQDKFSTSPMVGQRILEGDAILAPKKNEKGEVVLPKFPMPSDKDLMTAFTSAVGGGDSDMFRGRDQTQEAYYAAYKAVYAAEASAQGKTSGMYDSNLAMQAAHAVLGHVTQYGHTIVTVPAGMDPTHFEGVANAATKAALTGGGYSKADIASLHGYGLREIGDTLGTGRYVIINGNGDPLKSKDGKNTVYVDVNQQFAPDAPDRPFTARFPSHGR